MKKVLSLFLSATLVWTSGSLSQAAALAPEVFVAPSDLPQFRLNPPGKLGRVADYFNAERASARGSEREINKEAEPLVILIQDLHAHYGVQKNIAGLLDFLADKLPHSRAPSLPFAVAVEGASGPVDSSILALFPDEKIKLQAADYLMRQGELTGSEYFAVQKRLPHLLVGAENESFYVTHRELFRKTLDDRQALVASLKEIQTQVADMPRFVFRTHSALWNFHQKVEAYDRGELSTHEFIGMLVPAATGIDLKKEFPALASFAANSRYGTMDDIRSATASFLTQIQSKLSAEEKKNLQVLAKNQGTTNYYLYLRELIYQKQLFLVAPPALAQYLEYLHAAQTMGMDRVTHEAKELAFRIKLQLAQEPSARASERASGSTKQDSDSHAPALPRSPAQDLVQVQHDLDLLLRLADLQATEFEVRDFAPRLNQFVALTKSLIPPSSFEETKIRRLISSSIDFYVMALVRNKPMIENTLQLIAAGDLSGGEPRKAGIPKRRRKVAHLKNRFLSPTSRLSRRSGIPAPQETRPLPNVAVLIAGGFHTVQLTNLLREKNISYLVLSPTMDSISDADRDLYVKRLKGDHLTVEQVMADARSSSRPTIQDRIPDFLVKLLPLQKNKLSTLSTGLAYAGKAGLTVAAIVATGLALQHLPIDSLHMTQLLHAPGLHHWLSNNAVKTAIPLLLAAPLTVAGVFGNSSNRVLRKPGSVPETSNSPSIETFQPVPQLGQENLWQSQTPDRADPELIQQLRNKITITPFGSDTDSLIPEAQKELDAIFAAIQSRPLTVFERTLFTYFVKGDGVNIPIYFSSNVTEDSYANHGKDNPFVRFSPGHLPRTIYENLKHEMSHVYDYRHIPPADHSLSGYHPDTLQADFFREFRANLWATNWDFERALVFTIETYHGSDIVDAIIPLFPAGTPAPLIYEISRRLSLEIDRSLNARREIDKTVVLNMLSDIHLKIKGEMDDFIAARTELDLARKGTDQARLSAAETAFMGADARFSIALAEAAPPIAAPSSMRHALSTPDTWWAGAVRSRLLGITEGYENRVSIAKWILWRLGVNSRSIENSIGLDRDRWSHEVQERRARYNRDQAPFQAPLLQSQLTTDEWRSIHADYAPYAWSEIFSAWLSPYKFLDDHVGDREKLHRALRELRNISFGAFTQGSKWGFLASGIAFLMAVRGHLLPNSDPYYIVPGLAVMLITLVSGIWNLRRKSSTYHYEHNVNPENAAAILTLPGRGPNGPRRGRSQQGIFVFGAVVTPSNATPEQNAFGVVLEQLAKHAGKQELVTKAIVNALFALDPKTVITQEQLTTASNLIGILPNNNEVLSPLRPFQDTINDLRNAKEFNQDDLRLRLTAARLEVTRSIARDIEAKWGKGRKSGDPADINTFVKHIQTLTKVPESEVDRRYELMQPLYESSPLFDAMVANGKINLNDLSFKVLDELFKTRLIEPAYASGMLALTRDIEKDEGEINGKKALYDGVNAKDFESPWRTPFGRRIAGRLAIALGNTPSAGMKNRILELAAQKVADRLKFPDMTLEKLADRVARLIEQEKELLRLGSYETPSEYQWYARLGTTFFEDRLGRSLSPREEVDFQTEIATRFDGKEISTIPLIVLRTMAQSFAEGILHSTYRFTTGSTKDPTPFTVTLRPDSSYLVLQGIVPGGSSRAPKILRKEIKLDGTQEIILLIAREESERGIQVHATAAIEPTGVHQNRLLLDVRQALERKYRQAKVQIHKVNAVAYPGISSSGNTLIRISADRTKMEILSATEPGSSLGPRDVHWEGGIHHESSPLLSFSSSEIEDTWTPLDGSLKASLFPGTYVAGAIYYLLGNSDAERIDVLKEWTKGGVHQKEVEDRLRQKLGLPPGTPLEGRAFHQHLIQNAPDLERQIRTQFVKFYEKQYIHRDDFLSHHYFPMPEARQRAVFALKLYKRIPTWAPIAIISAMFIFIGVLGSTNLTWWVSIPLMLASIGFSGYYAYWSHTQGADAFHGWHNDRDPEAALTMMSAPAPLETIPAQLADHVFGNKRMQGDPAGAQALARELVRILSMARERLLKVPTGEIDRMAMMDDPIDAAIVTSLSDAKGDSGAVDLGEPTGGQGFPDQAVLVEALEASLAAGGDFGSVWTKAKAGPLATVQKRLTDNHPLYQLLATGTKALDSLKTQFLAEVDARAQKEYTAWAEQLWQAASTQHPGREDQALVLYLYIANKISENVGRIAASANTGTGPDIGKISDPLKASQEFLQTELTKEGSDLQKLQANLGVRITEQEFNDVLSDVIKGIMNPSVKTAVGVTVGNLQATTQKLARRAVFGKANIDRIRRTLMMKHPTFENYSVTLMEREYKLITGKNPTPVVSGIMIDFPGDSPLHVGREFAITRNFNKNLSGAAASLTVEDWQAIRSLYENLPGVPTLQDALIEFTLKDVEESKRASDRIRLKAALETERQKIENSIDQLESIFRTEIALALKGYPLANRLDPNSLFADHIGAFREMVFGTSGSRTEAAEAFLEKILSHEEAQNPGTPTGPVRPANSTKPAAPASSLPGQATKTAEEVQKEFKAALRKAMTARERVYNAPGNIDELLEQHWQAALGIGILESPEKIGMYVSLAIPRFDIGKYSAPTAAAAAPRTPASAQAPAPAPPAPAAVQPPVASVAAASVKNPAVVDPAVYRARVKGTFERLIGLQSSAKGLNAKQIGKIAGEQTDIFIRENADPNLSPAELSAKITSMISRINFRSLGGMVLQFEWYRPLAATAEWLLALLAPAAVIAIGHPSGALESAAAVIVAGSLAPLGLLLLHALFNPSVLRGFNGVGVRAMFKDSAAVAMAGAVGLVGFTSGLPIVMVLGGLTTVALSVPLLLKHTQLNFGGVYALQNNATTHQSFLDTVRNWLATRHLWMTHRIFNQTIGLISNSNAHVAALAGHPATAGDLDPKDLDTLMPGSDRSPVEVQRRSLIEIIRTAA